MNASQASPIYFYVYASSARVSFTSEDLLALLQKSRANNSAVGVTGMLLYRDGNFIQVLEGPEANVLATVARIERDDRHGGVVRLLQGHSPHRQFPDWSMGFRDLQSAEARQTPGFSEFMNEALRPADLAGNPTRIQRLLQVFRASMR